MFACAACPIFSFSVVFGLLVNQLFFGFLSVEGFVVSETVVML